MPKKWFSGIIQSNSWVPTAILPPGPLPNDFCDIFHSGGEMGYNGGRWPGLNSKLDWKCPGKVLVTTATGTIRVARLMFGGPRICGEMVEEPH